jgi:hypothetical protein
MKTLNDFIAELVDLSNKYGGNIIVVFDDEEEPNAEYQPSNGELPEAIVIA